MSDAVAAYALHVDARRHVEGRLFPRRRPARRHRRARRLPAARDGLARSAPDRRHGRRRSADQQGRGGVNDRRAPASTSIICSCRCSSIRRSSRDAQNCGNILAGVGPFAIERGLVARERRGDPRRDLHGEHRPGRRGDSRRRPAAAVTYRGEARIDGVPGTAAPIPLEFRDTAGSILRRAAADGQRGRRGQRRGVHADRQRHAVRRA